MFFGPNNADTINPKPTEVLQGPKPETLNGKPISSSGLREVTFSRIVQAIWDHNIGNYSCWWSVEHKGI